MGAIPRYFLEQGNYFNSAARICKAVSDYSMQALIKLSSDLFSETKLMADSCIENVNKLEFKIW